MTKKVQDTLKRINVLEGLANQIILEAAMLKKEMLGSDALNVSSRKGKGLPEEEVQKILGRRARNRIK